MFYSHEILTSSQYGVATIWLVATVGKGNQRKLSKKVIQEVDVPRACTKIIDPGAPLALRLQGNLLYGVSRVFAQQTGYVLTDVERTQAAMASVFRALMASQQDNNMISPSSHKAKEHQITLEDDPYFDPLGRMPRLDMIGWSDDIPPNDSQYSNTNSFYTPFTSQQSNPSSKHSGGLNINLPESLHSISSYRMPSDLGRPSPLVLKGMNEPDPLANFDPFANDPLMEVSDLGLNFDGDGNLIGMVDDDLELPPLPGSGIHREQLGPAELPQPLQPNKADLSTIQDKPSPSPKARAPLRKSRARKVSTMLDINERISSAEFRSWQENYLKDMDSLRAAKYVKATTPAQAKKNAVDLVFGQGIAAVGLTGTSGAQNQLASVFAGRSLQEILFGRVLEDVGETRGTKRGHRRRAHSEAFEDE